MTRRLRSTTKNEILLCCRPHLTLLLLLVIKHLADSIANKAASALLILRS